MGQKNTIKGHVLKPGASSGEPVYEAGTASSAARPGRGRGPVPEETQRGVGPDSARRLDTVFQGADASQPSERPSSEVQQTARGLGGKPAKIVTKPGVAPASDPAPLPLGSSAVDLEETGRVGVGVAQGSHQNVAAEEVTIEAARDELTPAEVGAFTNPGSRASFRTAPGGGKNRVSGGRASAAAYVSPSTVAPGQAVRPMTSKVQLHEQVKKEARSFHTEPSLLRRRASSLPPTEELASAAFSTKKWLILGGMAALVGGVGTFWAAAWLQSAESDAPDLPPFTTELHSGVPSVDRKVEESSNSELPRPKSKPDSVQGAHTTLPSSREAAPAQKDAATTGALVPSQAAASSSLKPRPLKKTPPSPTQITPAPSPAQKKKDDLWLE